MTNSEIKQQVETVTVRTRTLSIDRDALLALLGKHGIPSTAEVRVRVPGGADWSNMDLSLNDSPVIVTWVETEREED